MRHITLFNAMSNYDWVRTFTDEMRYAFEQLGCVCQVIDAARNPTAAECQRRIEQFGPHMLFGFNAAGFGIRHPDGRFVPTEKNPYFNFMVDGPMYHGHWLPFMRQAHVYTGLCDPTHRRGARRLGIPDERLLEIRHGGHVSPLARDEERTTDVVVLGTIADPEQLRRSLQGQLPAGVFRIFEIVAETWIGNLELGLYDIFDSVLADIGVDLGAEERANLELVICSNVDRYVRNKERIRILRGLSDVPIRVFGNGWKQVIDWESRFSVGPELSFTQAHEELCRAKLLINIQPIAVHATAERALGALLNGAVLCTTVNHFLSRHFIEGEQFMPFRADSQGIEQIADGIRTLLAEPTRRIAMYENARQAALRGHTWKHRAAEILERTAVAEAAAE
jgi:hypothetical protein